MLNTNDIRRYLESIKRFGGVYSRDCVPGNYGDSIIVVNTHPSTKPGEHWLSFDKDLFYDRFVS